MVESNDRTSSLLQSIAISLLVKLALGKGHPPNLPQRGCRLVKFLKFIDRSSDSYIGRDNYFSLFYRKKVLFKLIFTFLRFLLVSSNVFFYSSLFTHFLNPSKNTEGEYLTQISFYLSFSSKLRCQI